MCVWGEGRGCWGIIILRGGGGGNGGGEVGER